MLSSKLKVTEIRIPVGPSQKQKSSDLSNLNAMQPVKHEELLHRTEIFLYIHTH